MESRGRLPILPAMGSAFRTSHLHSPMSSRLAPRTLSVRSRLVIVAGLCTALAALPTTLLAVRFVGAFSDSRHESASLASQRAWQSAIAAMAAHLVQANA